MTPVIFLSNPDTSWVLLKGNTQDRFHVVLGFSCHHRPSELGVVLAKGLGQQSMVYWLDFLAAWIRVTSCKINLKPKPQRFWDAPNDMPSSHIWEMGFLYICRCFIIFFNILDRTPKFYDANLACQPLAQCYETRADRFWEWHPSPPPMACVEWLENVGLLAHSLLPGLIPQSMDPLRTCCFKWERLVPCSSLLGQWGFFDPPTPKAHLSKDMVIRTLHYPYQKEFASVSYTGTWEE